MSPWCEWDRKYFTNLKFDTNYQASVAVKTNNLQLYVVDYMRIVFRMGGW